MTALTDVQLTHWRRTAQGFAVWAWVHRPAVVLSARISTFDGYPYPVLSLPFDSVTAGSAAAVEEGMTVLLGKTPGGDQYGRGRVRYDAAAGTACSSSVLYVQRSSYGTFDGELVSAAGAYVTVLNLRQIWAVPPTITAAGVIYKDGTRAFSNAIHQRPVANAGPDVLRVVPPGQTSAVVQFGQTASFPMHPDSASIASYAWDFRDGVPATATGAVPPPITFPCGQRYVRLTVTDSQGYTHSAYALVAVVDEDAPDLLREYEITQHTERANGQSLTLNLAAPLPYTTYPDGVEVLLCTSEHPQAAGLSDRAHMLFAGWIQNEEHQASAKDGNLTARSTLVLADVAARLAALPGFPLTIERDSAPASWTQQQGATMDRVIHHVLDWHSSALTRADFIKSTTGETYALAGVDVGGASLYAMADGKAQAIAHKLTCDHYGRLAVRPDPLIQPTASQAAQFGLLGRTSSVTVDLTEADWESYRFSYARPPRVHWLWGEALVVNTQDFDQLAAQGAYYVAAPSLVPGQGEGEQRSGKQLVSNLYELAVREGNRYAARLNAREGYFEVQLRYSGAALHPADMDWVRLTISAGTAAPRGRTYHAERFLPIEITWRYNLEHGVRRASVTLERETSGIPAQQYIPPDSSYAPLPSGFSFGGGWSPVLVSEPNLLYPPNGVLPLKLFAVTLSGRVCRAYIDAASGTGYYEEVTSLPGNCYFAVSDPWDHRRKYFCCDDGIYVTNNLWVTGTVSYSKRQDGDSVFDEGCAAHYLALSPTRKGYALTVSGDGAMALSFNAMNNWGRHDLDGATPLPAQQAMFDYTAVGGHAALSPWNNARSEADGVVYAYNRWDSQIYRSKNWGRTWTDVHTVTEAGEGAALGRLVVPYLKDSGAPNRNGASQQVIGSVNSPGGDFGSLTWVRSATGGATWSEKRYDEDVYDWEQPGPTYTCGPPLLARHVVSTTEPGIVYTAMAYAPGYMEPRRLRAFKSTNQLKSIINGASSAKTGLLRFPTVYQGDPDDVYDNYGMGGIGAWGGSADALIMWGWGCVYTLDRGESWINIAPRFPWYPGEKQLAFVGFDLSDFIPRA